jgi:hypothetical protein
VTFLEFDEFELSNQKNNNSMSDLSDYVLFNSLFNFSANLNSLSMLSSLVFLQQGSEQHLDSAIVFSSLFSLSSNLTHFLIVDSSCTDSDFEDLLLYLVYVFSSFPSLSLNNTTASSMALEEFTAFYQLSLHVFSSLFSHYYSLY